MNYPAYFDYNATTPVDARVLEVMLPFFNTHFGNAASRTHVYGLLAEAAIDEAREQVARLVGANPNDVVFTSGATESVNLALKGAFEANRHQGNHIITVATEHKAVLDTCEHLEKAGAHVTYLQPDANGLITPDQFRDAITPTTVLVSVMLANNETGVIQPIHQLADITRERGILFHTDATQAAGKLPVDLRNSPIDLLSLSGHKLYAPKGIGALIIRNKTTIIAQQDGGRHERGRRSGTLNVPGIVALGKAAQLCQHDMTTEALRITELRNQLETGILTAVPDCYVNGSLTSRLPNTTSIAFAGLDGETLLASLNRIAVSNGSACNAASTEPSHVLKAMGLSDDLAYSSVRFSLGRFTTSDEVRSAIDHVTTVIGRLRLNQDRL